MSSEETSRFYQSFSQTLGTTLLKQVKAGDNGAWHRLIKLYSPVVYGLCRRCGVQPEDAEDIAQEVFRAAARSMDKFERKSASSSLRGWLFTIARNKIRDYVRAKAGRANAVGGTQIQRRLGEIPDYLDNVDESVVEPGKDDQHQLIHSVLEMLRDEFEEKTWTAFWRATVKGHTSAEIAEDLDMSKPAIRQAKYRVLRRLRQEVGGLL